MIHVYRRVSTDEQANGLGVQSDIAIRWLSKNEKPTTWWTDEGVSGAISLAERPSGSQMTAALQRGDTVVAAKLDRLFRSVADAANTIKAWQVMDIKLAAVSEGFDMTKPYGVAMAQMAIVFAELERAILQQRTNETMAMKKERGECCGQLPYGFNKDANGVLMPNEQEQAVIQHMRVLRSTGWKYTDIARKLQAMGVKTKNGRERWDREVIRDILHRTIDKSQVSR